jgi:anti-sigma regulatory factor (Ser/Thr protein kinase)
VQTSDAAGAGLPEAASDSFPAQSFDFRVAPSDDAASAARAALADAFDDHLSEAVLADAQLVLSELVTNSVRHAGLAATEAVHVVARLNRGRMRLEVHDAGTSGAVAPRLPDVLGGYGLHVVAGIAHDWGVVRDGQTCVWTELLL